MLTLCIFLSFFLSNKFLLLQSLLKTLVLLIFYVLLFTSVFLLFLFNFYNKKLLRFSILKVEEYLFFIFCKIF
jgi:hypothetical protein